MRHQRFAGSLLIGVSVGLLACGGDAETQAAPEEMQVADLTMDECWLRPETSQEDARARVSPRSVTPVTFENGQGVLCYGAPSARGREVMGELVPFGSAWRVGADEATALHLTGPASIGGVALEAGAYSIYAEPGAEEWTFFVNPSYERWGIPIRPEVRETEIGSFTATPEAMDEMVETMRFRYEPDDDNAMGNIVLEWENTRVSFHLHPGG